ncbi:hypothetical protein [Streptomyces arenae]|uniref:hypothetical protein n=1 Tax=Streptomyces arenae TaxID=29301 RepID=UPI00265A1273|nr:hypothetical protein [Streptomyces arenae]MCG7206567.1 hypothetical protein [Streptomyces arenae]
MQPLPAPCPADLMPDATGTAAFEAAYRQAKDQDAAFVAVESPGEHWTVKTDMITVPQHAVADSVYDAIRAAVIHMIRAGEIPSGSSTGPVYFVLHDVADESRACELAAALHAALYGNPAPFARAMPTAS